MGTLQWLAEGRVPVCQVTLAFPLNGSPSLGVPYKEKIQTSPGKPKTLITQSDNPFFPHEMNLKF